MLVVEQNVRSALDSRRPRLRHAPRPHRARGPAPRRCATTRALRAQAARDVLHDRAAARRSKGWSSATRGACSAAATFSLAADFRVDGARSRRRHGPERLGQDDAVRADHRQQPADRRAGCCRRAGHPQGALRASATGSRSTTTSPTRCAASARQPPSFMLERAPAATTRWCICSTSRSSSLRTATSASCSTSSAAARARGASCSSACIRTSRSTSTSCARPASASCSCSRAGSARRPTSQHCSERARARLPRRSGAGRALRLQVRKAIVLGRGCHAAGLGPHQLDQRAEGDVGGGRTRPRPRADRRGRRLRRPRHATNTARSTPTAGSRPSRTTASCSGSPTPACATSRPATAPAASGPTTRRRAPRRHVDGLAADHAGARHDRGVLGPDPDARGQARPWPRSRPRPGAWGASGRSSRPARRPDLRRRRALHDGRHPGRRGLLPLSRAADRAPAAAASRPGTAG